MIRVVRVAVLAVVACGGGAKPVEPRVVAPIVEAPLDPACMAPGERLLVDGKLRCRELPLTIDFPPNTNLRREDSGNLTFIAAKLDRGVLALFIEPRFDVVDDVAGLRGRLEAAIKGIAPDAVISDDIEIAPQASIKGIAKSAQPPVATFAPDAPALPESELEPDEDFSEDFASATHLHEISDEMAELLFSADPATSATGMFKAAALRMAEMQEKKEQE